MDLPLKKELPEGTIVKWIFHFGSPDRTHTELNDFGIIHSFTVNDTVDNIIIMYLDETKASYSYEELVLGYNLDFMKASAFEVARLRKDGYLRRLKELSATLDYEKTAS